MKELEQLNYEALPEEQKELADTIGMEAYIKLVCVYAGCRINILKPETLLNEIRNRNIRSEFNGANHKQLARRYELSETSIRSILKYGKNK